MAVLGKTTAFQEAFFFYSQSPIPPHAKMSARRRLAKKLNKINRIKTYFL
jgi:hypothetical protein